MLTDKDLEFRCGDRVLLTHDAVDYYRGSKRGPFISPDQGGGTTGTVIEAHFRHENRPGADPRPYMVLWDNGVTNSYRIGDIRSAHEEQDIQGVE